jgi:hypothetical protein
VSFFLGFGLAYPTLFVKKCVSSHQLEHPMTFELGLPEISLGVILLSIFQFLATLWFSERLKAELQKENAVFAETLKWDLKVREQAKRVAEYMALARRLKKSSSEADFERANQLSWELAMWLPEDIYKEMTIAIAKPNQYINELSVIIAVRKILLGEKAGNLGADDIAHHAPGIGKNNHKKIK